MNNDQLNYIQEKAKAIGEGVVGLVEELLLTEAKRAHYKLQYTSVDNKLISLLDSTAKELRKEIDRYIDSQLATKSGN